MVPFYLKVNNKGNIIKNLNEFHLQLPPADLRFQSADLRLPSVDLRLPPAAPGEAGAG